MSLKSFCAKEKLNGHQICKTLWKRQGVFDQMLGGQFEALRMFLKRKFLFYAEEQLCLEKVYLHTVSPAIQDCTA